MSWCTAAMLLAIQGVGGVIPDDSTSRAIRSIAPKPVPVRTTLSPSDVIFDPRSAAPVASTLRSTDQRADEIARVSEQVRSTAADLQTQQLAVRQADERRQLLYQGVLAARERERSSAFGVAARAERENAERLMVESGLEVQRARQAEAETKSLLDRSVAAFQSIVSKLRDTFVRLPEESRGRPVLRNRMVVLVRNEATETEIRGALERAGVRAIESIPAARMLVVQSVDGDIAVTQMSTRLDRLRAEAVFEAATFDSLLRTQSLPKAGNVKVTKDGRSYQDMWSSGGPAAGAADGTAWQKRQRFPAAWNLIDAIRRVSPNGVPLAVLDEGFDTSHEDVELDACPVQPSAGPINAKHGNHVAGIVAARFGDPLGTSGGTGGLIKPLACAVPPAALFGPVSIYTYVQMTSVISAFGDILANVPSLKVVNISLGYGWSIDPETDPQALAEMKGAGDIVRSFAKLAANAGVVLVSAAGNDSSTSREVDAKYGNPFNWNARDPRNPARNIIVVESVSPSGSRSEFSNTQGDIAAEGEDVLSASAGGQSAYSVESGTSVAAPQVAAVVALMRAYNPALTIDEIRTALGVDPRPAAGTPRLDAFAALLRAAPQKALRDLADLNGDSRVDALDLDLLRQQHKKIAADPSLNYFPRIDFNGDGVFSSDDSRRADVLGKPMTDLEVFAEAATDPILTLVYVKASINS